MVKLGQDCQAPLTHRALQIQEFLRSIQWTFVKEELARLEKNAMASLLEGKDFGEVQRGRGMLEVIQSIPKRFELLSQEREKEEKE